MSVLSKWKDNVCWCLIFMYSSSLHLFSINIPGGTTIIYILIAEVPLFLSPLAAPPTCSARGGFVCAAVPPLDNGGPGLLTMAPTSEPTYYTVALWDRFPETETRVLGWAPVSWMWEKAGKEKEEGDGKEEAHKCLWGKTEDSGWGNFNLAPRVCEKFCVN